MWKIGPRSFGALALSATLVLLAGCNTVPIVERPPIVVPAGLTAAQVEASIMQSVFGLQMEIPRKNAEVQEDAPAQPTYIQTRHSQWRFEGREPGVVAASISPRSHYLRVKIHYGAQKVFVTIDAANHMKYDGHRIHGKAIRWIGNLENTIRSGLSLAAALPKA